MSLTTIFHNILYVLSKCLHYICSPQNHILGIIVGIGIGLLIVPIRPQIMAIFHNILNRMRRFFIHLKHTITPYMDENMSIATFIVLWLEFLAICLGKFPNVYLKLGNVFIALCGVFVKAVALIVVGTFIILATLHYVGSIQERQYQRLAFIKQSHPRMRRRREQITRAQAHEWDYDNVQNTPGAAVIRISLKCIVIWLGIWFGIFIVLSVFRELHMSIA